MRERKGIIKKSQVLMKQQIDGLRKINKATSGSFEKNNKTKTLLTNEFVTVNFPTKKIPSPDGFLDDFS